MANNTFMSEKKKALLAQKQQKLVELQYYEKRIEDERSKSNIEFFFDDPSSDSDDDIVITNNGPSITQLKLEQSKLRTCLQATHELTSLQILQSEVTLIVNDPVITGEPPINEPGTWREVTAECRIDLVPFSITFYNHKPNAKFGATSYRGLNVVLVKAAHETELSKSVLPTVVRPSDAVEVIRSYAEAYRSRRSTLARLATKYADSLHMEPMEDGGYLLKCANLLQMAWRLENRWSPLSPFHHRMKFDIEYMDEKYITIITQCHKQLSDPTISSDERTLLLSKIIATCLEANPVSESAESDQDAGGPPKRRATLDQEIEEPENKRKREVMAPPKSLPKKAKVSNTTHNFRRNDNSSGNTAIGENRQADKENVDNNVVDMSVTVGKTGSRESVASGSKNSKKTVGKQQTKNTESTIEENIPTKIIPNNKTTKTKNVNQNKVLEKESEKTGKATEPKTSKNIENKEKTKKVTKIAATVSSGKSNDVTGTKNNQLNEETSNKNNQKGVVVENTVNPVNTEIISNKKIKKPSKPKSNDGNKNNANENIRSTTTTKPVQTNKKATKENTNIHFGKNDRSNEKGEQTVSNAIEKEQNAGLMQKVVEKNANNKIKDNIVDISKKVPKVKSIDSLKNKLSANKVVDKNDDTIKRKATSESNDVHAKTKRSITEKNADNFAIVKNKIASKMASEINSDVINQKTTKTKDDASTKTKNSNSENNTNKKLVASDKNKITTGHATNNAPKNFIEKHKINNPNTKPQVKRNDNIEDAKKSNTKKPVLPLRMQNNLKMARKSIGNIKVVAAKENGAKIKSKIPQKKLSPLNENVLKKNPLRMSPRHMASTFNSTSSLTKQSVQKINTHIPRLAKPMTKLK